jgi:tetratricopeptide (TPR) repeat protein
MGSNGAPMMVRDGRSRLQEHTRCAKILALLPVLALLAACGMTTKGSQMMASVMTPPPPPPPPPQMILPMVPEPPQATPGLAARERLQLAITLLQQGDAAHAEVELKAYLAEIPNNPSAHNLLSQIETPLEMLYPAENFTVQLGRDETLSFLAGLYLGDALAWYGLARYNDISNPSRVREGQTIRIPSTPTALAAQAMRAQMMAMTPASMTPTMPDEPPSAAQQQASAAPARPPVAPLRPIDPWVSIRSDVTAGRFENAIRTAEMNNVRPDRTQALVLASAYAANARAVRAADAMVAGAQALRAGQLYLDPANQPEDAIPPLALAVEINPSNIQAQTLLTTAKTRAADTYYRNGLIAFQRQDLDGAIAAWDKVLAIDPNHRNAQLQRAQALELKANLQRLSR